MSWYLKALKNYAVFSGRAQRMEYWIFALFNAIISIALGMIDRFTGSFSSDSHFGLLGGLFALAMFIPALAVAVRRLHDTDRTGWWILILFVPLIGAIWFLVLMILDGTPGNNRYGSDPKEADDGDFA